MGRRGAVNVGMEWGKKNRVAIKRLKSKRQQKSDQKTILRTYVPSTNDFMDVCLCQDREWVAAKAPLRPLRRTCRQAEWRQWMAKLYEITVLFQAGT
jgi:hypothetical protein